MSRLPLLLIAALVVAAASCSSSETNLTGPSSSKCAVTVANSMDMAPALGGSGTLTLTTARECAWAASSGAGWVVITSSTSGQGEGAITYHVATNLDPSPRQASIEVNASKATIRQEPAACAFSVAPLAPSVDAAGGTLAIQVQPLANCAWTAVSSIGWVRVVSGTTGTGSGSVGLSIDANTGPERTGTIAVAGAAVTVTQASGLPDAPPPPPPGCAASIQPGGQTVGPSGGTGSLTITSGASCSWTAVPSVSWISISSAASGTGNATVTFVVAANTGAARTGTVTVAGRVFTVSQGGAAAPCMYQLSPALIELSAGAASGSTAVSTTAGCAWTAVSAAPWVAVSAGSASGTGPGTVMFSVAANPGPARSGTVNIGGQVLTIEQQGTPCEGEIAPVSQDFAAAGGNGSVSVTAASTCTWTATSNDPSWLTVTAGSSGTGNGTVAFSVTAQDAGSARTGTISIAGRTFTVTQTGVPSCAPSITPVRQTISGAGGGGSIAVTAGSACTWAATSNAAWLTITSGADGTGNGTVTFSAAANTGPARRGTLTVAGQTFTVDQNAQ